MMLLFNISVFFILLMISLPNVLGEDLYELLGVSRQATAVDIRKSFKKLALTMHPDKNRDDEQAHEKFIKINRAYEVLKDEDLRKKYDKFGEDGLKEGGPSGGGYQSWNFYNQQFGIYDDDQEIITLSRSDFDISVEGTSDVWFINFYSPHCSHCHDLAPTWREVARELVGVVRMGAVNCEDEWHLCRQKGVGSYPTLLLYPEREKYYGTKSKQDLVKYVLDHVRSSVVELWSGNFKEATSDPKNVLPWLINFCRSESECLESTTMIKLSAMLDELVHVASMFCKDGDKVCEEIGIEEGLFFFESSKITKSQGLEITSYDSREIAYSVLAQLPDVAMLDERGFETALKEVQENVTIAWLIHFVEGESKDLELRKLPSLVESVKVGRVNCKMFDSTCKSLHVVKFPAFLLFKSLGGHEIHYGRHTAHDIAAFAKNSYQTPVRTLGPQDFPEVTHELWFIDYFAPWCPPCMRLLPEFRKASKMVGGAVKFGTVDCTIHASLCSTFNVHSYPTTILYNQSKPHQYHGGHHSSEIAEFVQDILKPSVKILVPETFQILVTSRLLEELWLVDFYAPWCGPCQQLAPEWRKLAKMLSDMKYVNVGQVDCQEHRSLCQSLNVQSYPSIRLYPRGRDDNAMFHVYNGWYRDAQSIRAWAFEFLPSRTHKLNEGNFDSKVFKSPKPWVIDFYAPWCGHCQVFAPEFERVALELRGRVRAGKVNCDESPKICQKAGVQAYPSVRWYKANLEPQNYYGTDVNSQDANYIINHLGNMFPAKTKETTPRVDL